MLLLVLLLVWSSFSNGAGGSCAYGCGDIVRVKRTWTYQQLRVRTERGVPLDIVFLLFLVVEMEGWKEERNEGK